MLAKKTRPLAAIAIRQVEKNTGASRNAFEQTKALSELGYNVIILAERGNRQNAKQQGAKLVKLPRWPIKGPFRRFWFNRLVKAWCKIKSPDLLISHGDAESTDVIYMHNCVHLASDRISGMLLPEKHETGSIHDYVLSKRNYNLVVANSFLMANDLRERYDIPDNKIEVIYPCYDADFFNIEKAQKYRNSARRELNICDDKLLIGLITSGNFKKRNVSGFINICKLINEKIPHRCHFLVVGKDNMQEYQQLATDNGIEDQFTWRTTTHNVTKLYGALDLFLLPAHIEEFGRVALEAMACGTPTLVSSWVGASEILEDHFKDLILEDYNSEKWAERAVSILTSEDHKNLGKELAILAKNHSHEKQLITLKNSFRKINT
ncbi:glycosyltransferase family 4 protein [Halomonas sp. SH5A2]|uniref:glycosyltransferase family 4 protein n=1 Tax=Halomonas sp. SH5A2 TaxID=2749040 RepID=UPI0016420035|nr:glycosyltransferase family 4 protein [Halomonas sp. SH5A2]QNI01468.1 glycosyltransferase family 4 protein [Halomonas sp. SH5A2]